MGIIWYSKMLIELWQFYGNMIEVRLFEHNGAGVMHTNVHSQHIL